jgi:hypothetical protein
MESESERDDSGATLAIALYAKPTGSSTTQKHIQRTRSDCFLLCAKTTTVGRKNWLQAKFHKVSSSPRWEVKSLSQDLTRQCPRYRPYKVGVKCTRARSTLRDRSLARMSAGRSDDVPAVQFSPPLYGFANVCVCVCVCGSVSAENRSVFSSKARSFLLLGRSRHETMSSLQDPERRNFAHPYSASRNGFSSDLASLFWCSRHNSLRETESARTNW